jgi:hypothetical protein
MSTSLKCQLAVITQLSRGRGRGRGRGRTPAVDTNCASADPVQRSRLTRQQSKKMPIVEQVIDPQSPRVFVIEGAITRYLA